jgi:hypothetical protein
MSLHAAPVPAPQKAPAAPPNTAQVTVGTFEVFSLWLVPWTALHFILPGTVVSPFLSNATATLFSALYHPVVLRDGMVATLASFSWHLFLLLLSRPDLSVPGIMANALAMLLYSLAVGDAYSIYFVKLPAVASRMTAAERWTAGLRKTVARVSESLPP